MQVFRSKNSTRSPRSALVFLAVALPTLVSSLALSPVVSLAQVKTNAIVFPILTPRVSSEFGFRVHPIRGYSAKHQGVDLAVPEGSHVRAIMSGRIVFADRYAGFGKLITVDHGGGRMSLYGHLNEFLVNVGDEVPAGALLGRVGQTGAATGPHLHFEWRIKGKAVNPLKVFPSLASSADG